MKIDKYISTFLNPADPYRYGHEWYGFPRAKNLKQFYCDDQIEIGFQLSRHGHKIRLKRFNDAGWSKQRKEKTGTKFNSFRCDINRKDNDRRKKWWFAKYHPCVDVAFLMFDIDRHYPENATPDEKARIDFYAQQEVDKLISVFGADSLAWVTSPGQIKDGVHVQGLHAFALMEDAVQFSKLREDVAAFKEYHSIEAESLDTLSMFRLPGQRHVEVCNPRTYEILFPLSESDSRDKSLAVFCRALEKLVPVNNRELFADALEWKASKNKPVESAPLVAHPVRESFNREQALEVVNTFTVLKKLCSDKTHKYRATNFQVALEEVVKELPSLRPSTSETCKNFRLMYAKAKCSLKHMFTKYDPTKCNRQDLDDAERIAESVTIEDKWLIGGLKKLGYDDEFISFWKEYRKLEKQYNGRVHHEKLYQSFGSQRQWDKVKVKAQSNAFAIYVEYDREGHKCRQWGSHKTLLELARKLRDAARWYVKFGEEIKQKIRSASPSISPTEILQQVAIHYLSFVAPQSTGQPESNSAPLFYALTLPLGTSQNHEWDKLLRHTA